MSDIVTSMVRRITEEEAEKYRGQIRKSVEKAVKHILSSETGKKLIERVVYDKIESWLEDDFDIQDLLKAGDYHKLIKRMMKL